MPSGMRCLPLGGFNTAHQGLAFAQLYEYIARQRSAAAQSRIDDRPEIY